MQIVENKPNVLSSDIKSCFDMLLLLFVFPFVKMHFSFDCFSLILITSFIFSVQSAIEIVITEQTIAKVNCNRSESEHIKQLNNREYTVNGSVCFEDILSVSFRNCDLSNLPQIFLEKFLRVTELYISLRKMRTIKSANLRGNKNLRKLTAAFNLLRELPPFLFTNTPEIEEVDFYGNEIEHIDPDTFAEGVEHLSKIDLAMNRIKTLHGGLFRNAVSLTAIDLMLNQIEYFGLKLVKSNESQDLDSYNEAILNCMIFPYKNEKMLSIGLYQYVIKNDSVNVLENVEINCDCDNKYLFPRKAPLDDYLNIDGVKLDITY